MLSPAEFLDREIDSINTLLSQKSNNLQELLELRASGETESYYSRVLNELQKVDETFEDPNYEQRFKDLAPHQRVCWCVCWNMQKSKIQSLRILQ